MEKDYGIGWSDLSAMPRAELNVLLLDAASTSGAGSAAGCDLKSDAAKVLPVAEQYDLQLLRNGSGSMDRREEAERIAGDYGSGRSGFRLSDLAWSANDMIRGTIMGMAEEAVLGEDAGKKSDWRQFATFVSEPVDAGRAERRLPGIGARLQDIGLVGPAGPGE